MAHSRGQDAILEETRHVVGWKLEPEQRKQLLARFAPIYRDVVADHVTLSAGVSTDVVPPADTDAEIVGEADDKNGVQAMVVRIGGISDRPDGSTYHITWSLDRTKGRKAVESNDVIRKFGWEPLQDPVPIRLRGARFPFGR